MIYTIYIPISCLRPRVSLVNQGVNLFDCHVLVEGGATESRRLERTVFKSLEQFSTGHVAAVKGARTTNAANIVASGEFISSTITRTG